MNDTAIPVRDTVNDTPFALLRENPHTTAEELARALNVSIATVKRRIKRLKAQGLLERVGSDKTGYWRRCDK